ncbi:integrase core domain-containing protein [Streptomyces sp. NPDC057909]|uniref:integrase core domain-containing protein n=1 Tax=Streptomyces sp. NPDC057909 TaxID=3346277 RepID=UPI0036E465EC
MNAHCERVIGTIRREALDHVMILGENHARKVLTGYQDHYNRHRPHRTPATVTAPSSPQSCTTSTTEARSAPGLSAASSTSIDTPRDLQRQPFDPCMVRCGNSCAPHVRRHQDRPPPRPPCESPTRLSFQTRTDLDDSYRRVATPPMMRRDKSLTVAPVRPIRLVRRRAPGDDGR